MIIKVTSYKGTYEIEAQGVSNAMAYMGGVAWKLTGPVKVNGQEIPMGTITFPGISIIDINGETDSGLVKLDVSEFGILIWVNKKITGSLMNINPSDVMASNDALSAIHGSFGPFDYNIDVHLDTSDYSKSYFYVELSIWGIHLINAHLDANNPKVTIDASVLGAGVEGTLGVDFNQCRVYVEVVLKYIFDKKKYSFDIYNWSNCSADYIPGEANDSIACALTAQSSGYISVRNTGGYVAEFYVDYTVNGVRLSKESGEFTAGVTKTIDIPSDATDITLHVKEAYFIHSWTTIFSEHFDEPVCKKYHIWGTTLNPKWEEEN